MEQLSIQLGRILVAISLWVLVVFFGATGAATWAFSDSTFDYRRSYEASFAIAAVMTFILTSVILIVYMRFLAWWFNKSYKKSMTAALLGLAIFTIPNIAIIASVKITTCNEDVWDERWQCNYNALSYVWLAIFATCAASFIGIATFLISKKHQFKPSKKSGAKAK